MCAQPFFIFPMQMRTEKTAHDLIIEALSAKLSDTAEVGDATLVSRSKLTQGIQRALELKARKTLKIGRC